MFKRDFSWGNVQGGAPQVISWFIPLTIDISPTKTIVIGVINQLSYLGGTTLYPAWKRLHNYGKIHHFIAGKIHYFYGHFQ